METKNAKNGNAVVTKSESIAKVRKNYTIYADEQLRGFFANLKQLQSDASRANLPGKEFVKLKISDTERAALIALKDVMQRKGLQVEDLTKNYLTTYLPNAINSSAQICKVTLVAFEEEEETRKLYADRPEMLVERDNRLFIYKPVKLFTANSFLTLFCKAADAKRKAAADKAAADKAAEREAREAAQIEAFRRKVAAYDAKVAASANVEQSA